MINASEAPEGFKAVSAEKVRILGERFPIAVCVGCAFDGDSVPCRPRGGTTSSCVGLERKDGKDVVFVKNIGGGRDE